MVKTNNFRASQSAAHTRVHSAVGWRKGTVGVVGMASSVGEDYQPVDFEAAMQTGLSSVDSQHATLIGELNRLISEPEATPDSELFSEVLSRLGRELGAHFEFEEGVLAKLGIAGREFEEHIAAHTQIMSQYTELNLKLMTRRSLSRLEALSLMRAWIVDHILQHDVKLRRTPAA